MSVGAADPANVFAAKTVAFLLPDLGGGGAERVTLTLAKTFVERGHRIDLLLMDRHGELLDMVPSGVEIVDLKSKRIRNVIRPLIRYLRERRPDALLVSMWPLTVAAILARGLARSSTRLVVSDHSTLGRQYGGSRLTLRLLQMTVRLFYPLADARVLVSQGAANDLARLSGLRRESLEVVHNPVFAPPSQSMSRPDINALWRGADVRILTVANLLPVKNQALLIRSFARLRQRFPAKLMLVGSGELKGDLKQLAASLGVAGDVIFAGFVADPWPYYASANLFVLSSDYEGFGNVLVEAMRCGLPVVSTDCESGPREILDGGRFGKLVPVGDERALVKAMEEELRSPHPPGVLRERAEQLSGAETADRYLGLLIGPR
ncbi:MAG: glycosyltransferase [Sphingomonas sp.]